MATSADRSVTPDELVSEFTDMVASAKSVLGILGVLLCVFHLAGILDDASCPQENSKGR